jgi:hypothetical protein
MKIREVLDVLRAHPGFVSKIGWIPEGDGSIANCKFGKFKHIVVCNNDGEPQHDAIVYDENHSQPTEKGPSITGAVIVPYYIEPNKGLITLGLNDQIRYALINGKTGERGNMVSREFPRGFSKLGESNIETALREGGEETRKHLQNVKQIGVSVANTSFFGHGAGVYSAEFNPEIKSSISPDSDERILRLNYETLPGVLYRIREDPSYIFCGLTKSALTDFIASLSPKLLSRQMKEFNRLSSRKMYSPAK